MKRGSNYKNIFSDEVLEETVDTSDLEEENVAEEEPERVEAEVVMTGVVSAYMLNIRSGPGLSFPPEGTLYKGEVVEYTMENDEWIKLTGARKGYCMKKFIQ